MKNIRRENRPLAPPLVPPLKKDAAKGKIYIKKGDARNLDFVPDESIDLICTYPPYADIIKHSDGASIVN